MKVKFEERGQENSPTIVFVHGAGGSSATWTMQLRQLSSDFHIVALDLNGHGETPIRENDNLLVTYLDDIESVVRQFHYPILSGHSMGGALTQLYAIKNPNQLKGIILVGTGARLRVSPMIFNLLDNDFDGYINAMGQFAFHPDTPSGIIEASLIEARKCSVPVIRRDFEFCDKFDIMDEVGEISLPTLILVGDKDQMTPPKYSAYFHKNIKVSEYQIIKKAGHSVMLEQARLFNDAILKWVTSIT
jgi:pimeloyl-ACP methyl ester carboxylesterase